MDDSNARTESFLSSKKSKHSGYDVRQSVIRKIKLYKSFVSSQGTRDLLNMLEAQETELQAEWSQVVVVVL